MYLRKPSSEGFFIFVNKMTISLYYQHRQISFCQKKDYLRKNKLSCMILKQTLRPLRYSTLLCLLYVANISLKSQTKGNGSMTQFYIVTIVFTVLVLAAVISIFISKKKKK